MSEAVKGLVKKFDGVTLKLNLDSPKDADEMPTRIIDDFKDAFPIDEAFGNLEEESVSV
jgi:hypothetical protein